MKAHLLLRTLAFSLALFSFGSCTSLPNGVEPVTNFDLQAYLGKWYEVARLDHRFERDLENVSAFYSLREDGSIKVLNRGYSTTKQKWQEIEGSALSVGAADVGHLKVSFFGPFYSSYCIFELDSGGQHAFVSGASRQYLWLLSRKPEVSPAVWSRFQARASELGFDTASLIRVQHGSPEELDAQ